MRRKVGGTAKKVSGTRKHRRKTTRRRGRVSGVNGISGLFMKAGGLIAGAVVARELNTLIVKFAPTFSPLMSGLVQIGAGFFLPKVIKGPFFADMADGMIANGGMVTIVSTGLISGIGGIGSQTRDRMAYRINGTGYMPTVSGARGTSFPAVAGGSGMFPVVSGTSAWGVVNGPTTRTNNTPIFNTMM